VPIESFDTFRHAEAPSHDGSITDVKPSGTSQALLTINRLAEKEFAADTGMGPPLSSTEKADLGSCREFPDDADSHYRTLARKEIIAESGPGPDLTIEERAELAAKRQFPGDSDADKHYHDLVRRENGLGASLSREEQADLFSERLFPGDSESAKGERERLYKRMLTDSDREDSLSPLAEADLLSKREFPAPNRLEQLYRQLAYQEFLFKEARGPELNMMEKNMLDKARSISHDHLMVTSPYSKS
jgi:hypothetical protein